MSSGAGTHLQEHTGEDLHWPSLPCPIVFLTRTDEAGLRDRLLSRFSWLELRWMLSCGYYSQHKQKVRFGRCLRCLISKKTSCGSATAEFQCRSRLEVAPGCTLRPPYAAARQLTHARVDDAMEKAAKFVRLDDKSTWTTTKKKKKRAGPDANKHGPDVATVQAPKQGGRDHDCELECEACWEVIEKYLDPEDIHARWEYVNHVTNKEYVARMAMYNHTQKTEKRVLDRRVLGLPPPPPEASAPKGGAMAEFKPLARPTETQRREFGGLSRAFWPSDEDEETYRRQLSGPYSVLDGKPKFPWHWNPILRSDVKLAEKVLRTPKYFNELRSIWDATASATDPETPHAQAATHQTRRPAL
ncbi:hypothetical protein WJX72_002501 [[Myrmecia] bisecta]|uniref:Uncharacterized protein n=1 Tax=[Myrmecia] bisecta TaxID=41462 RepID=A0AAW1QEH8_9CHLO